MEKGKGTLIKDALILFAITLVLAILLGFAYEITKAPIAEQKEKAKTEAYKSVLADLDKTEESSELKEWVDSSKQVLAENKEYDFTGICIDEALFAKSAKGETLGYVLQVTTQNGYGGSITFAMGYMADGTVGGIEFLSINETAGLGMKAKKPAFMNQFFDKKTESFGLYKNETSQIIKGDTHVDAISSATITSDAVVNAVNAGTYFAKRLAEANIGGIKR